MYSREKNYRVAQECRCQLGTHIVLYGVVLIGFSVFVVPSNCTLFLTRIGQLYHIHLLNFNGLTLEL